MPQLEAYRFQIGVVILHLLGQLLLLWGEMQGSGADGFFGGSYFWEGWEVGFSVQLLVVGMEPELVYRVPVAVQVPAIALPGDIQELGRKLRFQSLRKGVIGELRCGLVIRQLFFGIGGVNLGQGGFQLLKELLIGFCALCACHSIASFH